MRRIGLTLGLIAALIGCDDEEKAEVDMTPIVGVMELPIAHRNAEAVPEGTMGIEVSPSELRLDGHKVLDLDGGKLPATAGTGRPITPLTAAIGASSRAVASLRLHVNTPYGTTARIIATLAEKGVPKLGFVVRKGNGPELGWMGLGSYEIEPETEELAEIEGAPMDWDTFAGAWEKVHTACRKEHYVDCDYPPENIASGGKLHMRLFARGNALKLELHRFGVEEGEEEAGEGGEGGGGAALIEGIAAAPTGDGEEEIPPATDAAFTWRFEAATAAVTPIADATEPLCASQPCGVVVSAEGGTSTMRLVSFLGAAFPSGRPAPHVRFVLPAR